MSLSDNLGVSGAGRPIVCDGKELRICKITQGQKDEFCAWYLAKVKKQVYDSAAEHRKMAREIWDEIPDMQEQLAHMPGEKHRDYMALKNEITDRSMEARSLEQQARDMVADLNKDIAADQYEWDGAETNKGLNTAGGGYRITWILLREKQPDITQAEIVEFYRHKDQAQELHDIVQWALGFGGEEKKPPKSPSASTNGTTTTGESSPAKKDLTA